MGRHMSTIRAGFYICVVPFLLVQLWFATVKLRDGQPATVISRIQHPRIRLPAVNICSDETKVSGRSSNATLISLFEKAREIEMIVKHALFRDGEYRWHNLLNETSLREIFGISFEEAWGEIYLYMPRPRLLVKCWILRQFVDVLPALTAQVNLGTDSRTFISFHDEYQFIWPYSELLGNMPYGAGTTIPPNAKDQIRVERRYTTRLSREGDGKCSEGNNERPQICLQEFIQKTMNCTLPWIKNTNEENMRQCDTPEDLSTYGHLVTRFASTTSQLGDIISETTCQMNCRTVEYSAKRISLMTNVTSHSRNYFFSLAMPQTSTVEEKEVLTYDGNNFIADVGGLLGLLLGVSVMDLAVVLERMSAKAKRARQNRCRKPV